MPALVSSSDEVALAVARQLVVFLRRPGGQSQFSVALALKTTDERFERRHAFMLEVKNGSRTSTRRHSRRFLLFPAMSGYLQTLTVEAEGPDRRLKSDF